MEKYRQARRQLMDLADRYKKRGISCKVIYDEIGNKLSGVRAVAAYDLDLSMDEFDVICEEIHSAICLLMKDYRKEIGLENEQ